MPKRQQLLKATNMRQMLILAASLSLCSYCAAQEADVEKLFAQSEPGIQEQINRVYNALNQSGVDPQSNGAAFQEIHTLKDSIADKGEIVKQLAIFAATPGDEQRPLMTNAILQLLDLPPKIVIRVLAPYLSADNPNLRSFVRDWFQGHDNAGTDVSPLDQVKYEDYKTYLRGVLNTRQEVPAAFVEYIYERSPDRALLVFYFATKWERGKEPDILLAEHIVSNAIWLKKNKFDERFQTALPEASAELAKLAKYKEWWVRYYVAEIMRRYPDLRQPDVFQQLSTDNNALVSKAAKPDNK
jgi:hypothetical protein